MSSVVLKTLDSESAVKFPVTMKSPGTGAALTVGTSPVTIAGLGLQVGISPASAETDSAHVKMSVASIRFIDVTPV